MTYPTTRARRLGRLARLILATTLPLLALGSMAGCESDEANTAEEPEGQGGEGDSQSSTGGQGVIPNGGSSAPEAGASPGELGGTGGEGGAPPTPEPSLYAMSSIAFGDEGTATYLNLLESLDVEETDFTKAREFPGQADIWVHEGALFVAESDARTITKFTVEDGKLVEGDQISFTNFGLTDFGFWVNVFVAPDKAYVQNGTAEYVIWNPEAMEITGTLPLPELPERGTTAAFLGYADRSAPVRDGLLYQTVYYTDESFWEYDAGSQLLVIDTETDQVADVLDLPCPGIDFSTRDEDDNLYFSSWVFAPGGAALLDQPTTCVVELAAGEDTPTKLFDVTDVTEGHEGGVMRYLGDGKALLSVLHDENSESSVITEVAFGANWRFWLYDLTDGSASVIEDLDWNAGAAYPAEIAGKPHTLVPSGDYSSTQVFAIESDGTVIPRVKSLGWSLRLFGLK